MTKKIFWLLIWLLINVLISLCFGTTFYDFWNFSEWPKSTIQNFLELRLVRVVAAIFVGSSLSIGTLLLRGITKNKLSDPGLIGINQGAQLGMAIILLFMHRVNHLSLFIGSFIGTVIAVLILLIVMQKQNNLLVFLLVGIAISALCTGGIQILASLPQYSKILINWNTSGLQGVTLEQLLILIISLVGASILLTIHYKSIYILLLDSTQAIQLGISYRYVIFIITIIFILMFGSSIAIVGNLVFAGLLFVEITEYISYESFEQKLITAALVGSIGIVLIDMIGRVLAAPNEVSLNAILLLFAAPVFLFKVNSKEKFNE